MGRSICRNLILAGQASPVQAGLVPAVLAGLLPRPLRLPLLLAPTTPLWPFPPFPPLPPLRPRLCLAQVTPLPGRSRPSSNRWCPPSRPRPLRICRASWRLHLRTPLAWLPPPRLWPSARPPLPPSLSPLALTPPLDRRCRLALSSCGSGGSGTSSTGRTTSAVWTGARKPPRRWRCRWHCSSRRGGVEVIGLCRCCGRRRSELWAVVWSGSVWRGVFVVFGGSFRLVLLFYL